MKHNTTRFASLAVVLGIAAGCGTESGATATDSVTVTNCGAEVTFDQPLDRLFVNDGGMIAIALAAGARDKMVAVSSLARDKDVLRLEFGAQVDTLNEVATEQPTLENIVGGAEPPQVLYAGYNYGMSESRGITPEILASHGIDVYQLSEACRQVDGQAQRGTMDPWVALDTDLRNIGTITGNPEQGARVADDIDRRLEKLRGAPQPAERPTAFVFDSVSDTIFSSGSFGGPQGIIDAAGARNATEDVEDTWTAVSWERITTADPDLIVFVDYPRPVGGTEDRRAAQQSGQPQPEGRAREPLCEPALRDVGVEPAQHRRGRDLAIGPRKARPGTGIGHHSGVGRQAAEPGRQRLAGLRPRATTVSRRRHPRSRHSARWV